MTSCSFTSKCKNKNSGKCSNCKWNSEVQLGNHLMLQTEDGKNIKYLENSLSG